MLSHQIVAEDIYQGLWVKFPASEVPQGNSEEINKAQCSVMITFVFIAYSNNKHLATAVLTCWKKKSLPFLYGELTSSLTLQAKKEFSNIGFVWKDQRSGDRNKCDISLQHVEQSIKWCWSPHQVSLFQDEFPTTTLSFPGAVVQTQKPEILHRPFYITFEH